MKRPRRKDEGELEMETSTSMKVAGLQTVHSKLVEMTHAHNWLKIFTRVEAIGL